MKNIPRLALVILAAFLFGCKSDSGAIKGKKIEIKFVGDYLDGDWIQIDGIKLTHFTTDTFALKLADTIYTKKKPMDFFYENKDCKCLPASVLWEQINNAWFAQHINRAYMSYHFVKLFNMNSQYESKADYYEFESRPGYMINGIVRIYNPEGKEIRIRTSSNYPAQITTIE